TPLRKGHIELSDRHHHRRRDDEPCEPFIVGGYHEPRCVLRCGSPDRFLERVHVVVPKLALVYIGGREFPMLLRLVEARHEALFLLLVRQMQEEFEDGRPLASEILLEMSDVGQSLVPDALVNESGWQLLS